MTQDSKIILTVGAITVAIIAGAVFLLNKSSSSSTSIPKAVDPKLLIRDDSFRIASDSAKVTIVEFSDLECPACAAAHPEIDRVLRDYQGKVDFVFRHFPLPQHKLAIPAAEAAEAAGEQGKFWEMAGKLFANQTTWEVSDKSEDLFVGYAKDLVLDTDKFKSSLDNHKFRDKIQRDYQDALALKLDSTPTFFINGLKMEEAPSYDNFKSKIDAQLNK